MLDEKEKEDIKKRLKDLDEKEKKYLEGKKPEKIIRYQETTNTLIRYTHLGLEFCAIFLVFFFGGRYLDGKLNTAPWLMIIFIFAGFFGGLIRIIKVAKEIPEK